SRPTAPWRWSCSTCSAPGCAGAADRSAPTRPPQGEGVHVELPRPPVCVGRTRHRRPDPVPPDPPLTEGGSPFQLPDVPHPLSASPDAPEPARQPALADPPGHGAHPAGHRVRPAVPPPCRAVGPG